MEAWGDYIFRSHTLSRWAMAAVQDIIQLISHEHDLEDAVSFVHDRSVPEHLTEREWKEDVLPLTEIRL